MPDAPKPTTSAGLHVDKRIELYGGEVVMCYNDEAHVYWIEGTDHFIPSVTTVSKVIAKPKLLPWAVREALKFVRRYWKPGRPYRYGEIDHVLREAETAHETTSGQATDIGSAAHNWIEDYVGACIAGDEYMPEFPEDERSWPCIQAFLDWVDEHHVEFLASEQKVYSRCYDYGGTFDCLAMVDGVLTLIDFKTSKRIYDEYELQIASYVWAYEEEQEHLHGPGGYDRIEAGMILRIPKDGKRFETRPVLDLDALFRVYLSVLHLYDWTEGRHQWAPGSRAPGRMDRAAVKAAFPSPGKIRVALDGLRRAA